MTGLSKISLPDEEVFCSEALAIPSSVPRTRRWVRTVLRLWSLPTEPIETAELLLTELVTNAIRHGGSQSPDLHESGETDRIEVAVRYLAGELVIEVSDSNLVPPVVAEPNGDSERWHGMNLVSTLSRKWGHYPRHGAAGKTVYCVIAAPVDAEGGGRDYGGS